MGTAQRFAHWPIRQWVTLSAHMRSWKNFVALGNRWTFEIAEVYAFLGDADEAFAWFDRAIERRDASLLETVTDPFLDGIRDDPRFDELLERLGRKQSL